MQPSPDSLAPGEHAAHPSGVRFARLLSDVLSPPLVAAFAFWILAGAFGRDDRWSIFAVCALAQTVLPVVYLKWAVARGWIGDVDMSRRDERRLGLPVLGLVYLIGCIGVGVAQVPAPVLTVCISSLAVIAGIWVSNLAYKASGHVAGVTAYMTALSLLVQPIHIGLLLIPALSWARVRSGAHTVAQTLWGAALGWVIVVSLYVGLKDPLGL